MAKPRLTPSMSWNVENGESEVSDYRRSYQMFFKLGENELIRHVEQKISDITHIPIENGEGLQVVRYSKGGYYKVHWDYFEVEWDSNQHMLGRGGQRIITAMLYLNTLSSADGETYFPYISLNVEPRQGMALIWHNIGKNGQIDRSTFHEARPVKEGEKWIATKWLREHEFR